MGYRLTLCRASCAFVVAEVAEAPTVDYELGAGRIHWSSMLPNSSDGARRISNHRHPHILNQHLVVNVSFQFFRRIERARPISAAMSPSKIMWKSP